MSEPTIESITIDGVRMLVIDQLLDEKTYGKHKTIEVNGIKKTVISDDYFTVQDSCEILSDSDSDSDVSESDSSESDSSKQSESDSFEFYITCEVDAVQVEQLLELGMDVNIRNTYDIPLFSYFAGFPVVSIVRMMNNYGVDLNIKDPYGNTPLIYAIVNDTYHLKEYRTVRILDAVETVEELIDAGADVNQRNNKGESPLMIAKLYLKLLKLSEKHYEIIKKARTDIIKLLIDAGAEE